MIYFYEVYQRTPGRKPHFQEFISANINSRLLTKNGKQYENVILQDKTGTIDAKIWDPNSMGIREFEALDYVDIMGDVSSFNGALQVSIKKCPRKAEEGEYNPADYLPTSRYDINTMYQELLSWIGTVKNQYLSELLTYYFIQDQETAKRFRMSSAAKSVHHGSSAAF